MSNHNLGHLVIHRCEGQTFTIGADVRVEVVRVHGGQCTLRITAPKSVTILRDDAKVTQPKHRDE